MLALVEGDGAEVLPPTSGCFESTCDITVFSLDEGLDSCFASSRWAAPLLDSLTLNLTMIEPARTSTISTSAAVKPSADATSLANLFLQIDWKRTGAQRACVR